MKYFFWGFILFTTTLAAQDRAKSDFDIVNQTETSKEDQEKGKNYIHQGLANEKVKEFCANGQKGFEDICDEDEAGFKTDEKFLGLVNANSLERALPMVSKAMAVFGISSGFSSHLKQGDKFRYKEPGVEGESLYGAGDKVPEGAEPVTEEKKDYCGFIALISETASAVLVKDKNEVSEENFKSSKPEARQAAAFRALADAQENQADGSKIQFGVWGATAACYVAYAAQGTMTGNKSLWIKMGLATFMATFYKKKMDAHKERAKILRRLANKLPQAGDCNPFTEKSCFCSNETSFQSDPTNFNKVCIPEELAARNQNNDATFCADKNGKVDKECKCKKTKSCIDRNLKIAGVELGLKPVTLRDPLESLSPLSKGLTGARFDDATRRNLGIARKTLKKFKPTEDLKLNDKQKELARSLVKSGLPRNAAALIAGNTKSGASEGKIPSLASAGLSRNALSFGNKNAAVEEINPRFKNGTKRSAYGPSRRRSNPFSRKRKRSRKTKGVHIEDFAMKATREAEISKNTERGIFEIISNRYKIKTLQKSFE